MPLKYACYDKQCGDEETCKGGTCVSATLTEEQARAKFPTYSPDLVDGTGGGCFYVAALHGRGGSGRHRLVVLLLTPLVQALLGGRQERHARRVRTGVLLVEVEGPAVHGRHEAVVTSGPVGRPAEVAPDLHTEQLIL